MFNRLAAAGRGSQRRTNGVDDARPLLSDLFESTDPFASISHGSDTLDFVWASEGWQEEVPCEVAEVSSLQGKSVKVASFRTHIMYTYDVLPKEQAIYVQKMSSVVLKELRARTRRLWTGRHWKSRVGTRTVDRPQLSNLPRPRSKHSIQFNSSPSQLQETVVETHLRHSSRNRATPMVWRRSPPSSRGAEIWASRASQ